MLGLPLKEAFAGITRYPVACSPFLSRRPLPGSPGTQWHARPSSQGGLRRDHHVPSGVLALPLKEAFAGITRYPVACSPFLSRRPLPGSPGTQWHARPSSQGGLCRDHQVPSGMLALPLKEAFAGITRYPVACSAFLSRRPSPGSPGTQWHARPSSQGGLCRDHQVPSGMLGLPLKEAFAGITMSPVACSPCLSRRPLPGSPGTQWHARPSSQGGLCRDHQVPSGMLALPLKEAFAGITRYPVACSPFLSRRPL